MFVSFETALISCSILEFALRHKLLVLSREREGTEGLEFGGWVGSGAGATCAIQVLNCEQAAAYKTFCLREGQEALEGKEEEDRIFEKITEDH